MIDISNVTFSTFALTHFHPLVAQPGNYPNGYFFTALDVTLY